MWSSKLRKVTTRSRSSSVWAIGTSFDFQPGMLRGMSSSKGSVFCLLLLKENVEYELEEYDRQERCNACKDE